MQEKVKKYREIRRKVYEDATKPTEYTKIEHNYNQETLKKKNLEICSNANLNNFLNTDSDSVRLLWYLMWGKIFYANRQATTINEFLKSMRPYFDCYTNFQSSGWDDEYSQHFIEYLTNQGPFNSIKTYKSISRVKKVVQLARTVDSHIKKGNSLLSLFHDEKDIWTTYQNLIKLGYPGPLTALHFMMDIGLPVMKPDITLSRLFLKLGWLHDAVPQLPKDLTREDLQGKGHYGSIYHYTNRRMYKNVIDLAREIAAAANTKDLEDDIGWVSNNPLREFDIFMVKAVQVPDPEFGIVRTLYPLADGDDPAPANTCC